LIEVVRIFSAVFHDSQVHWLRVEGHPRSTDKRCWQQTFERTEDKNMRFKIEEPQSDNHDRMMIVSDYAGREHRLFFFTEESEERFFDNPAGA